MHALLSILAEEQPDIVIAEAGASPCEPYNGDIVLQELADHASIVILCASDPYAVVGMSRFLEKEGIHPDIVTGSATSTTAGLDLIRELCDIPPLSLASDKGISEMKKLLVDMLDVHGNDDDNSNNHEVASPTPEAVYTRTHNCAGILL